MKEESFGLAEDPAYRRKENRELTDKEALLDMDHRVPLPTIEPKRELLIHHRKIVRME